METVRFGIEFVPSSEFSTLDVAYHARNAEELGFSNVWITDHYNNRNVYVTLTHVALYTNRITIGAGVTNPYHINPAVIASSIATIDEIAGGRTVLGIGAGDYTTLSNLGIERKKALAAMRESVKIIRQLWAGKSISIEGDVFNIPKAKLGFAIDHIMPIYLAAQGPKMTALSAELTEGVLINGSHPSDFIYAMEILKREALKLERVIRPPNFDLAAYTVFSVASSREAAEKASKIPIAYIIAGSLPEVLERHGISIENAKKIYDLVFRRKHKEAGDAVTDDMVETFAIVGDVDECIDKIESLIKTDVSQIVCGSPLGEDVTKAIRVIGKEIIPQFREKE